MPRLDPDLEAGIVAAIKAGKTRSIIHVETGVPESTIRWVAIKHALTIHSRYTRTHQSTYWRRYWGSAAKAR